MSPSHSLTTHPGQPAVLQAPFRVRALHRCTILYLSHCVFTVPFLCLDSDILTTVLWLPTVFFTVRRTDHRLDHIA